MFGYRIRSKCGTPNPATKKSKSARGNREPAPPYFVKLSGVDEAADVLNFQKSPPTHQAEAGL